MTKILMIIASSVAIGCAGANDDQVGRTPAGELVAATHVSASASYALPPGARVVADPVNNRFLVVTSKGQNTYALGKGVSCGCDGTCPPVALSGLIGCTAGADLRISEYRYFPLDAPAAQFTDERIVAAPELSISALARHTTRSCGIKPDDFTTVVARFGEDLLVQSTSQTTYTRVLLDYKGAPAVAIVPRGLFPEYDGASSHVTGTSSVEEDDGGDSSSCKCNAGSGCTAKSSFGVHWCEAGSCTSCTMAM